MLCDYESVFWNKMAVVSSHIIQWHHDYGPVADAFTAKKYIDQESVTRATLIRIVRAKWR